MNKKAILPIVILISVILITACGNKSNQKKENNEANTEANIKPNSDKHDKKESNKESNPKLVKNGNLKKINEYRYDQFGTKQILVRNTSLNKIQTNGDISYTINKVKVYKNEAKNDSALNAAKQALNVENLSNPYYSVQVKFSIKNSSDKTIYLQGIEYLKLGHTFLSPYAGLNDLSAGKKIPANSYKSSSVVGAINLYPDKGSIKFSPAYDKKGNGISNASDNIEFSY
ncbi:hypothetical protein GSH19_01830 [Lactobacillus sp. S2-2]|uniref:hypothetical protein n=1 Tax=Lactobacillus sp. S2-2 TaxID=2692917 RepID=UPI001F30A1CD|nr:hypothetical protein [Lactobacillus sp. S2-2]MCF6514903.1 hypothetical protein [Lactobacillus sp. S2-2]